MRSTDAAPRVAICVVTFRRPRSLGRLLEHLAKLEFPDAVHPRLRVVVVDNDADESARAVCADHRDRLAWPLEYVTEPRRGISIARNTAVRRVREDSDWLAFIDDDETPSPRWLGELLRVQAACDADVVSGPVLPRFEVPPPAWITGFYARARYPTGASPPFGATNNVLVRTSAFGDGDRPFDERLGLVGGEDTLFFMKAARSGRRHVWADDGVVYEWMAPSRVRVRWLMRRSFRKASTLAICERRLDGSLTVRARRVTKALGQIGYGAASLVFAGFRGRRAAVRYLLRICQGAGGLAGVAGLSYEEYRVTHGS